jgi:hypothetical protein
MLSLESVIGLLWWVIETDEVAECLHEPAE